MMLGPSTGLSGPVARRRVWGLVAGPGSRRIHYREWLNRSGWWSDDQSGNGGRASALLDMLDAVKQQCDRGRRLERAPGIDRQNKDLTCKKLA